MSVLGSVISSPITSTLLTLGSSYLSMQGQKQSYGEAMSASAFNTQMDLLSANQLKDEEITTLNNLNQQELEAQAYVSRKGRQLVGRNTAYYASRGVELAGSPLINLMDNVNQISESKSRLYADYYNRYTGIKKQFEYAQQKYRYAAAFGQRHISNLGTAEKYSLLGTGLATAKELL